MRDAGCGMWDAGCAVRRMWHGRQHPAPRAPRPGQEAPMAIKGSLKEASLPDVLQLLAMGKKTGCLSVTHRNSFGYIYFDKGRICYASIVNRRDRLGDMLVKLGTISQGQLDAGVELQGRRRDSRLGELLVEQGAL